MEKLSVTVGGVKGEMKIRDFLKKNLGFSTSLIAKVKFGGVFINGTNVHMRATVKCGDTVEVIFPDEDSATVEPINIPLDVIYEDEYILVVNKPLNMPIHPSRGNSLPTLANAVRAYMNCPFVFRCITRLDRDTSGIVLIAKDRLSAAALSEDMKAGKIEKLYHARVMGTPSPARGVISAPIERENIDTIKRIVTENGKPSITEYSVISTDGETSLVEARPITGRTHQIRVHLAYIGHPLYADFLYGERVEGETYSLHCLQIVFSHPKTGKVMKITSPYPEKE